MSNLDVQPSWPSSSTDWPFSVVECPPSVSCSLIADCGYNLDKVKTVMQPVLKVRERCQVTSNYIQAIATGRTNFLVTNLVASAERVGDAWATAIASSWLVGRHSSCALPILHLSISRHHAVIGHHSGQFYLADVGSSNGTWINGQRLGAGDRYDLHDGDVIRFGSLLVEFFMASHMIVPPTRMPYAGEDTL
ncbi:MAG: FHA domain-containing protein [Elainellaceae cyanobacterium]